MPGRLTALFAATAISLSACSAATDDAPPGAGAAFAPARHGAGNARLEDTAELLAALDIDELRALEEARAPAGDYWARNAAAQSERLERILAAERAARAAVTAHFGAAAAEAAVFRDLFRPLHDRLPALSSAQQIAIHELERRYLAAELESATADAYAEHVARIRELLGAAIATQYALRTSPLAAELRNAGVDFSEAEFIDVFRILDRRESSAGGFLEARRLLRERLGSRRFVHLWSRRDPRFAELQAAAVGLGLTEDELLAAYALLLDNEDAMLAAAQSRDPDSPGAQDDLRSIYDGARRRLTELLGEPAGESLLRSFSAAAARVSAMRR